MDTRHGSAQAIPRPTIHARFGVPNSYIEMRSADATRRLRHESVEIGALMCLRGTVSAPVDTGIWKVVSPRGVSKSSGETETRDAYHHEEHESELLTIQIREEVDRIAKKPQNDRCHRGR